MARVRAHKDIAGVIFIAALVVTLYSYWGAYMLTNSDERPQVAVESKR